ncbi:hypothetical protein NR798_44540 [Archangium gephyra]|uniref:hypothetical protein n=1 Tax=Archangium gephyra TaxID=48 RepID=UPI0035D4D10B
MSGPSQKPESSRPKKLRPFKRIDYVYKEYVRLNEKVDAYLQGSFSDFKMLAALGSLVSFAISGLALYAHNGKVELGVAGPAGQQHVAQMAFVGFLCALSVAAILWFRDLLKQSIIEALVQNLCRYEQQLQQRLELEGTQTFALNTELAHWGRSQHRWLLLLFQLVFALAIGGIPAYVLALVQPANETNFARIYLLICGGFFLLAQLGAGLLSRFQMPAPQPPATGGDRT